MCTVTFLATANGFCLTSNRDEKTDRATAIPPQTYSINGREICFPKDPKAGGTWIAHDTQNIIILLNGAQEKHVPKPSYRKSRGLIVLDLLANENVLDNWNAIDLQGIEPFTIVFFNGKGLFQLQWNETEKTLQTLDINKPHIWSSSTLYEASVREQRKIWFEEFLSEEQNVTPNSILDFHQFTQKENKEFGLQINRGNILKTVSITQCLYMNQEGISMQYLQL